ncbi:conserved exported hypothetical protein [Candidatus Sulfopaludibacter sp. SbA3]|nr:conserved exported hypothetical protein [Candidatus Sulfopaludibacter sp. SbA3]
MISAFFHSVKRATQLAAVLALCLSPLPCATLVRLSLSEMAAKSTAIVRAKVVDSSASLSGTVIYTHYKLQVSERLKGQNVVEVVVPGGIANGIQQVVPGAPRYNKGDEYVFFVWTGSDGLNRVIGLTQGMFLVTADGSADPAVTRSASHELMLDPKTGHPVKDETLAMRMSDLRSQIAGALAGAGK